MMRDSSPRRRRLTMLASESRAALIDRTGASAGNAACCGMAVSAAESWTR